MSVQIVSAAGAVGAVPVAADAGRRPWLARVALGGALCFLAAIVALHVLTPAYDPVTQMISEYALGPFGYLLTVAFLAWGAGTVALGIGLRAALPGSRAATAAALLGVAGASMFVNGIIPCDPGCANTTVLGTLHGILAFPFFFGGLGAMLLLLGPFGRDARWRAYRPLAAAVAMIAVVSFVGFFGVRATQLPLTGAAQRAVTLVLLAWFLLTANRLRSLSARPHGQ